MTTTNGELEELDKKYVPEKISSGNELYSGRTDAPSFRHGFNVAKKMLLDEFAKLLATHDKQLHQALLSGLPERNDMKHAKDAHSDAGAGHVIGFNYCLDQVEELINKVFNKEEK